MTSARAEDEVVELCLASSSGSTPPTPASPTATVGEREAAEYVAGEARRGRVRVRACSSRARPGAATSSAAWPGPTPSAARCSSTATSTSCRPTPREWSVHPFSGAVQDGYVWGRGAVDMKDMVAMTLAVAPRRSSATAWCRRATSCSPSSPTRRRAARTGAQWLVENRPDLFEGCTEAIGEVGGFSLTLNEDQRVYLIEAAEKGIAWMRLRARGRPGPRVVPARRQRRHQGRRGRRPAGQPHGSR